MGGNLEKNFEKNEPWMKIYTYTKITCETFSYSRPSVTFEHKGCEIYYDYIDFHSCKTAKDI